ncbi:MAG: bi-domain-containing oxidoreductase, partial [Pirellulales bacterium]
DHVRRVLEKVRNEGLFETLRQVRAKLDEPMSMGYSSAGVVLACGHGVSGYKVGERVASNGPHAGVVTVPVNLCARIPECVSYDHASVAVVGSIAMQGVRLGQVSLGESVLVIGLGLVGQLAVMILKAAGVRVIATDLDPEKCALAMKLGADVASSNLSVQQAQTFSNGYGVDAVLITAATESNAPIELAAAAIRQRGRVVLVGVTRIDIPRAPFYEKEAEFTVSCSYGPGRYDPEYEIEGRDYPLGFVRWTEQRNIQAVLDLMASKKLDIEPLISHRFLIDKADKAYEMVFGNTERYLGVILQYPEVDSTRTLNTITIRSTKKVNDNIRIGVIGAGNFARLTMLPAIQRCSNVTFHSIASAHGMSAQNLGKQFGFSTVTTDESILLNDQNINSVFLLTRPNLHASQIISALRAGKNVFVEKPLAITAEELGEIEKTLLDLESSPLLMVGFNRRFSPACRKVRNFFEDVSAPLTVSFRFNAGFLPKDSWVQNEIVHGGRIIGEACHAIDTATYLVNSPPVRVYAESVGGPNAPSITDDQCFITIRHANGSISSIAYLAGGDRIIPKERIEVLGGGRMAVIDDFREVSLASGGKLKKHKLVGKGHLEEVEAFLDAVRLGKPSPIHWIEMKSVTIATILAVRSLREGIHFEF